MVKKKQIFIIFACDEWRSRGSSSLLMVTSSVRKLRSFLVKKISAGDFIYRDADLPISKQVKSFKYDFDHMDNTYINNNLLYGYYDYTYDGEEM